MTEQYISGYLDAISRVKDILTPHVGGFNCFFSIGKNTSVGLLENIHLYLTSSIEGKGFLVQQVQIE